VHTPEPKGAERSTRAAESSISALARSPVIDRILALHRAAGSGAAQRILARRASARQRLTAVLTAARPDLTRRKPR
jgi:hypothetical protein